MPPDVPSPSTIPLPTPTLPSPSRQPPRFPHATSSPVSSCATSPPLHLSASARPHPPRHLFSPTSPNPLLRPQHIPCENPQRTRKPQPQHQSSTEAPARERGRGSETPRSPFPVGEAARGEGPNASLRPIRSLRVEDPESDARNGGFIGASPSGGGWGGVTGAGV